MKAVSLFSGIGGFDLGLERAGIETVLQVEIDQFCRSILEKHWPYIRRIADIHDVTEADVQGVDLVYGGFPCQPVSYAGKRKAQDDERWLWPEFERVVRMARPRYVLVENVPGLLTAGLGDVLAGLSSLGFDAEWSIVSARGIGAPHTRERVFLVAYPHGERWRGGGVFDREYGVPCHGFWDAAKGIREWGEWQRWLGSLVAHGYRPDATPTFLGVDDGFPSRLDRSRVKALGNAVVPQVAELVGRRLMQIENA